jgi:hypothetical protein
MTTEDNMKSVLDNGDTVKLSFNSLIDRWVVVLTTGKMKVRVIQYMGESFEDAHSIFVQLTKKEG